jgi:eukaryotic-like serine/threonine-protein kinase
VIDRGTRLGPYEILEPIGAGGMGEVYRARDTRLERMVAVKVLPSHLSASSDVLQRFEREAKTISQLSHPNICALYDVGREGETEYLVMELLEGETLAERLVRGPLPIDQTLRFGAQIASALEAAHRRGIVHRDLKPSNVMLTKSGVKLLDFGLAKALAPPPTMESLTSAPTAAKDVTRPGMVLGTVPYMAPEQLQGRDTDSRADIFALGAVLHEMATGRKAFEGTSPVSIMSAILTSEPPAVSAVQPMSPPALDRLIRTCLAKDPDDRWQTARDVELQLSAITEGVSAPRAVAGSPRRLRTRWLPWLLAGAALAIAAAALLRGGASKPSPPSVIRFTAPPPPNGAFAIGGVESTVLALSPDGSQLAYLARDRESGPRIWLQPLAAFEPRPVPGTEGARSLFWSTDGHSIGFFVGNKLQRLDLPEGTPLTICDVPPGVGFSGTWGSGGDILFAAIQGEAIFRVSAAGGTPVRVLQPDPSRGEGRFSWPWFLPDGGRFLYLSRGLTGTSNVMLWAPGRPPTPVLPVSSRVQYTDPGFLVFARDGALLAQRLDPEHGRVIGEPFPIARSVRYFLSNGFAVFSVSRTGTLAFQSQDDVLRLLWFDRAGRQIGTVGPAGEYIHLAFSRDGRRVLFDRRRRGSGTPGIWSFDLERQTETPVTPGPETEAGPVMLPDGRSIVYSRVRGRSPQLVRRDLATGKEKDLLSFGAFQAAQDVSPDGETLLYAERSENGVFDIWTLPLSGGGKPAPFLQSAHNKSDARFSPDGRFVAFISSESGRPEAYLMPYPGPGEKIRVSPQGARVLRWSRDGEVLFVSDDNRMMTIPIRTTPSLQIGAPTELFALKGKSAWWNFDVSPDGKRFLAIVPEVIANELPLNVVVNWTSEAPR